jgi:hypothetical protein
MLLVFLLLSFFQKSLDAVEDKICCSYASTCSQELTWYGTFQVGYAYSYTSYLFNPDPLTWDKALEGYAASLGGAPFLKMGFGASVLRYLDVDVSYTYYQNFHYEKHQTGSETTPNFSGYMRNRFFSLSHQNVLLNATFCPKDRLYFSFWDLETTFFAGMGIGCGLSRVLPFYTVGYQQGVGSVANAGIKVNTASFAWQGTCGLRFHPRSSCCSLDVGYMFYDGGPYQVAQYLSVNDTKLQGNLKAARPLRGYLKTNQLTISFQYLF